MRVLVQPSTGRSAVGSLHRGDASSNHKLRVDTIITITSLRCTSLKHNTMVSAYKCPIFFLTQKRKGEHTYTHAHMHASTYARKEEGEGDSRQGWLEIGQPASKPWVSFQAKTEWVLDTLWH